MVSREVHELSLTTSKPEYDEEGLIIPKKLPNPVLDSRDHKDLKKEILWNKKAGINVLDKKTDLQKHMEKRSRNNEEKNRKVEEEETNKTPLQKMFDAKGIKPQTEDEGGISPENSEKNEYLDMRGKLRAVKN